MYFVNWIHLFLQNTNENNVVIEVCCKYQEF